LILETTLVVSEESATADQLCALLAADGVPTRQMAPAALMGDWNPDCAAPGLLLVNAALNLDLVRQVARRVMRATNVAPTMVAFVDGEPADIIPYVSAGLDYIIPPYVPGQIRSRLVACHFRQSLSRTAQEIQTAADLVRFERELQIGREIQAGFLPEALPTCDGWQLTARFLPAREVAGDFYDVFELVGGARIGLVVADVCDKGVGAALFMALIRTLLRHAAVHTDTTGGRAGSGGRRGSDAALILRAILATNDYLMANHVRQAYFATLFFAVLNPATGALVYVNCGHNPPVVRRADGECTLLDPTGPALGLMPNSAFELGRARLALGDMLFAYTDGVPEARDTAGRSFSRELMMDVICAVQGGADDVLDAIEGEIDAHVGAAERFDDITMVALLRQPRRRHPAPTRMAGRPGPARTGGTTTGRRAGGRRAEQQFGTRERRRTTQEPPTARLAGGARGQE